MFGLGALEMLILFVVPGMVVGAVLVVVFLVNRRGSQDADLRAENRQLREELDRRRD